MEPFNLELAKKGHTVVTRRGKTAKYIAHLQGKQPAPLVFEIKQKDKKTGQEFDMMENYFLDGRFNGIHDSDLDLFMEY